MTEQTMFGNVYEDKRTHRSGKLIEYNEKYKTYLLESSDGKTFNVTSSQFKVNWRMIEEAEVQEEVKPEVEPAKVKSKSTYKGPSEEKKKELNSAYTDAVLVAQQFVDGFNNDVAIKIVPAKNLFKLRIGRNIITSIYVLSKVDTLRVWLSERDFNTFVSACSIQPRCTKKYPYTGRCFTVEYSVKDLPTVLEDLKTILLDHLVDKEED